jgi:murein DD-endopeptidase MepM/ murein hydrolase activator NlpD
MEPATAAALVALARSRTGRRLAGWALVIAVVCVIAPFAAGLVIVLVAVSSAAPAAACPVSIHDGVPIMGPPMAVPETVMAWWGNRPDPPRLGVTVDELVELYYQEGRDEGVRPEIALAQAVVETGHFTSSDTAINNYAGIGHPDGAGSGGEFPSPSVGVRAHVQLLRAFAEGNDTDFANERVTPRAGARADTIVELAGTWATDPTYAEKVVTVLAAMTGRTQGDATASTSTCAGLGVTGAPISADGYALPVDAVWYERHPWWFAKPHHDYPAADVPVSEGTPVYAMVSGVVTAAPVGGMCGRGVWYRGDDGLAYVACHGRDGGLVVGPGDRVAAGQLIMHSSWTGNVSPPGPAGTHLHQGVRRSGVQVCPQAMFEAIAEGSPIDIDALPSAGCSY